MAYYDVAGYLRSSSVNSDKISLDDTWASGYGGGGAAVIGYLILNKTNSKKPVNLPSHKKVKLDLDHISSGHMPGGNRNPDGRKSVFWGLTTNQVIKAIYEAYKSSSKIQTQGDRIRLIGYSDSYNLVIEIWLNVVTKIIETAYPK